MPDILANNPITSLSAGIGGGDTTIPVDDSSLFPSAPFSAIVEQEIIRVVGLSEYELTVLRGQEGTLAAAHPSGAILAQVVTRRTWDIATDRYVNGLRLSAHATDDCPFSASGSTVYVHPRSPVIGLFIDSKMERCEVESIVPISLSGLTNGLPHDVFAYWDSDNQEVAFEVVQWSTVSARATAVVKALGGAFKDDDSTRRFIGTFGIHSDGNCHDTPQRRLVSNYDNRESRPVFSPASFNTISYSSGVNALGGTTYSPVIVCGDIGRNSTMLKAAFMTYGTGTSGQADLGIGIDSTAALSGDATRSRMRGYYTFAESSTTINTPQLGMRQFNALGQSSGTTITFYGTSAGHYQYGWTGSVNN